MRKRLALLIALSLVVGLFAGCTRGLLGSESKSTDDTDTATGSQSSLEGALENYVNVLYARKTPSKSQVMSILPDAIWEERGGFDYEEMIEEREYDIEDYIEEFGDDYTVTYEILSKEKMDEDDLEEGREAFEEYGMVGKKLTEAYMVEYEVTIKGSEGEDSHTEYSTILKYDGKWYVAG